MRARWLAVPIKWVAGLILLGGLALAAYRVHEMMVQARALEAGGEKLASPRRARDGVVDLGEAAAQRLGVREGPVKKILWGERVAVYGQVIPNPRATVEVRAPYSGILRAADSITWPTLGQSLNAGQTIGWIDIRIGPQERLTLQDNLNSARLKKIGADTVVQLQQARVDRLAHVALSEIVSRQQLEDAQVLLAEAKTQLAVATAAVELWQKALAEAEQPHAHKAPAYSQPLTAPGPGEVVDLAARPGMTVEAGGLIVQLVDFRRPLVRLDFPPALLTAGLPPKVTLSALAGSSTWRGMRAPGAAVELIAPVEAELIGAAPRVDATSQFLGCWYAFPASAQQGAADNSVRSAMMWRPGLQVRTEVKAAPEFARPALSVPLSAIVFHQGRSFLYVCVGAGKYARREVNLLGRDGAQWVLTVQQENEGQAVVIGGAQVLLSEEHRGDPGENN